MLSAPLDEARALLRTGDGAGARRALASADPASGEVLECLARAAYLELDFGSAIECWERAYGAYRASGDALGTIRVARTLGYIHGMIMGDGALMSGWLARAQTLLGTTGDSPEQGWVALNVGMFEGNRAEKERLFHEAIEIGRAHGDVPLELSALAYLGASLVHDDRTEEGMLFLDEALAAVSGNEVDEFIILEEIFCQLFSACERAHDVGRADQWIRVGDAIAARRKLPSVAAFCHTHYGGVLTAAGRWPEAERTLTEAVHLWGVGRRALLAGALVRLADLRVRQGRLEEAETLLDGLDSDIDAARSLAAIHLARSEHARAADVVERALAQLGPTSGAAAPLLTLLVDVHLAAGDVDAAQAASEQLTTCASLHPNEYVRAAAALAKGRICLATSSGDATACIREALAGFGRAHLPMELARARLALANALAADRPDVALAEARAALEAFENLQAARDADSAVSVLRSLSASGTTARGDIGLLTKRETEVLELLGLGLSNPEISDRLYISRKTVEHHVGSVLAKLGLRGRAEAAAYSARQKRGSQ